MGKINSIQSFGATDGPGLRFVIFFQGCPLRCSCCHNPDTWDIKQGKEISPEELIKQVLRYKTFFGEEGGITISGGEPLIQSNFAKEIFALAKKNNIHTCLDTSGLMIDNNVKELLDFTDMALLDIKYTDEADYQNHVGSKYHRVLAFLELLEAKNIPTWLRQVAIPSLNMTEENYSKLRDLKSKHQNVEKIELLPFKKLCSSKYENLGIEFPLKDEKEPTSEQMSWAKNITKGR